MLRRRPTLDQIPTFNSMHRFKSSGRSYPKQLWPTMTSGSHAPSVARTREMRARSLGDFWIFKLDLFLEKARVWSKSLGNTGKTSVLEIYCAADPSGRTNVRDVCFRFESQGSVWVSRSTPSRRDKEAHTISGLCVLGWTMALNFIPHVRTFGGGGEGDGVG